jgi:hypothetical protein
MARWDYRYLGFERFPDALSALEIEQFFALGAAELAEVGLKSVAVVTGARAVRSRDPYPFSSKSLPSLINARAAPETWYVDKRRDISALGAGSSAADTEGERTAPATTQTAHAADRGPLKLWIIISDRSSRQGAGVKAHRAERGSRPSIAADEVGCSLPVYRPHSKFGLRRTAAIAGVLTKVP